MFYKTKTTDSGIRFSQAFLYWKHSWESLRMCHTSAAIVSVAFSEVFMGGRVWSSAPGSAVRSLTSLDSRRRWSVLTRTAEKASHLCSLHASSFFCLLSWTILLHFFLFLLTCVSLIFASCFHPNATPNSVCFRSGVSCDSVKHLSQMQFCQEERCGFVPLKAIRTRAGNVTRKCNTIIYFRTLMNTLAVWFN